MSTSNDLDKRRDEVFATLQSQSTRFARELADVRMAMNECYERSIGRLSDARWVPLEEVTRIVDELNAAVALEQARATSLAADLEAARCEVENVRALCEVAVHSANEAAAREREEAEEKFSRELSAALEAARAAAATELQLRQELRAVQMRSQEIVDGQMLQLVEFKRELEQASAEAERARAQVESVRKENVRRLAQVQPISPKVEAARKDRLPEFAAIEAVLAGSPPVGAWQRVGE
jgi:hypothetical protein